jgi:hypothetical protein
LACALLFSAFAVRAVRADDDASPSLAISNPAHEGNYQLPPPGKTVRRPGEPSRAASGWWVGMAGLALALAVFGAVSMASRKLMPGRGAGPFEVLARASLSPKHTVHLVRAGDRMLIVGTGPQGPPALLGDWSGPLEPRRPAVRRPGAASNTPPTLDEPIGGES